MTASRPPYSTALAGSMTEAQLQAHVLDAARKLGWMAYHTRYSLGSVAGFPDLVLARAPRLLFVELKRENRDTTDAQADWLLALAQCGVFARVWRPSNWLSGEILEVLL